MSALRTVSPDEGLRARRWDVIVVGTGLAALVATARLGLAGHKVLVVGEAGVREAFPGLREPFFLAGARDGGLVETCLRGLKLPLIDRRRIRPERISYQVVAPDLRFEVGEAPITAEEFAAWRLTDFESSHALVRSLLDAATAERRVMLEAPLVRIGRRAGRARTPARIGSHVRGIPAEAAEATPEVTRLLATQARALSNLATAMPSPEARARLLGSAFAGGAGFEDDPPWLVGLLQRRIESLFGEFRYAAGELSLVDFRGQPGIQVRESGDLWVANALVIAAPLCALADTLDELPSAFGSPAQGRQRVAIHLRSTRAVLPENLASRLILTAPDRDDTGAASEAAPITVSIFPSADGGDKVDIVARSVLDQDGDPEACGDAIEEHVRAVFPFTTKKISRQKVDTPRWDSDDILEDPEPGRGWPGDVDLRVSARPPVYRLDRRAVAGLGLEGDLLLGWRGGDAVAGELA